MYHNWYYMNYVNQMNSYLQVQQKKIEEMNRVLQDMQKEITELKNRPQTVKNEYRFDLLKVENLHGTLNIGLTPNGNQNESNIGDLAINQSMDVSQVEQKHPEAYQRIQSQIENYLDGEAHQELSRLEALYDYPLDEQYRTFIIEDVKKQINQRILFYLHQVQPEQLDARQVTHIEEMTAQKVIQDINQSLEAFLRNLPKKGDR